MPIVRNPTRHLSSSPQSSEGHPKQGKSENSHSQEEPEGHD